MEFTRAPGHPAGDHISKLPLHLGLDMGLTLLQQNMKGSIVCDSHLLKRNSVPFISFQNSYAALQMRMITLVVGTEQDGRNPLTSSLLNERKKSATLCSGFSS